MPIWGSDEPRRAVAHSRGAAADDIDFEIVGLETQFVEIELDPGESAIAEAGAMMMKHRDISMETVFGDGSAKTSEKSFFGKLASAGKRMLSGESLFMTAFTHDGQGKARVSFAAPYPGKIIAMKLDQIGGKLICQRDAFLCAARGVQVDLYLQRKIMTGLFGGEGFIMQQLEGDGWVFVHAGGSIVERELAHGEVLHVDTGCLAAMTPDVDLDLEQVGGVKSWIFGGEGIFFAKLTGPGKVWIQSLPFSRLAGRIAANTPGVANTGTGEGSILGGFGDMFDGDN